MSGQGKYTVFAPIASEKNTLLSKLFKGNSTITNPLQDFVGKETEARMQAIALAKIYLMPTTQQGDAGHFPNGVNMNYTGDPNGISVPNLSEGGDVVWAKPGDAALPFAPDLRSPGPGQTDARSADNLQEKPDLTISDIKGPGYIPGAPGTGTKSPKNTSTAVADNFELGVTPVLGDSGANNV